MPTDYGKGRLADAIRAAIARPFNDHADPDRDYPWWDGNDAVYTLHVHRDNDGSLRWEIEVRDRCGEDFSSHNWCRDMATYCLRGLGVGGGLDEIAYGTNWGRWSRPCSPAEVREIEGIVK